METENNLLAQMPQNTEPDKAPGLDTVLVVAAGGLR